MFSDFHDTSVQVSTRLSILLTPPRVFWIRTLWVTYTTILPVPYRRFCRYHFELNSCLGPELLHAIRKCFYIVHACVCKHIFTRKWCVIFMADITVWSRITSHCRISLLSLVWTSCQKTISSPWRVPVRFRSKFVFYVTVTWIGCRCQILPDLTLPNNILVLKIQTVSLFAFCSHAPNFCWNVRFSIG